MQEGKKGPTTKAEVDQAFSRISVWLARALLFIGLYYTGVVLPSLALFRKYAQRVFGFESSDVTDGAWKVLSVSVGPVGWVWFSSRLISAFFRLQGCVRPLPFGQAVAELSNVVCVLVSLSMTSAGLYGVGLGLASSFLVALVINIGLLVFRGRDQPSSWSYRRSTIALPSLRAVLDPKMLWSLGALAVPAAISISADLLLYDACLPLIGRFSNPVVALDAHLVAMQLAVTQMVFLSTPNSITASVFVPRFIGRGDKMRAYAAGAIAALAAMFLNAGVSTVVLLNRRRLARLFIGDDPNADELVDLLAKIMPVYCVNAVLDACQTVMQATLRGLGRQAYILRVQIVASMLGIAASVTFAKSFTASGAVEPLLGVWLGLSVGIGAKVVMHTYGIIMTKWDAIIEAAHERNVLDAEGSFAQLGDEEGDGFSDDDDEGIATPEVPEGADDGVRELDELRDIPLEEI